MRAEMAPVATTLDGWDGTRSYAYAAFAAFPVKPQQRLELQALFALEGMPKRALPEEIWPDLDTALSRHRASVEDLRGDKPPAKTRAILRKLEKRLKQDANDLEGLLRDGVSRSVLGEDYAFWAWLHRDLETGLLKIPSYRARLDGHVGVKGPDRELRRSQRTMTAAVQNTLIRHGLSLITTGASTKKLYRDGFLARLFALADDPVQTARARRLITTVVGQGMAVVPTTD